MKRLALAASLLALAACQPPAATPDAAKPADGATAKPAAETAAGCSASKSVQWGPAGRAYKVEAWVAGSACANAVTTLAVYDSAGAPFYAWASPAQFLFSLKDATDAASMKAALNEWLSDGPQDDTTGTLPAWEETDGQPKRAEFPFMPREGMDKAAYDDLKKQKLPMLCFPQGIESEQCLALYAGQDGAPPMVEEIGVQLFPG